MQEKEELADYQIENKNRILIYAGILVGALIIGFVFGYFVLRGGGDGDGGFDRKFMEIIKSGDISGCNEMLSEKDLIYCKIMLSASIGDESFCNTNLANNVTLSYFSPASAKVIELNPNDYCWIIMTQYNRVNYCENVKDLEAKQACLKGWDYIGNE